MALMAGHLLIVDDEPTQLALLEAMLAREGYGVERAQSGRQAVTRLRSGKPVDLMVLDLSMPDMSGIEVLEAIRPDHPHLPVVVLTAHSSVTTVVEAMRAGATDFIVKPVSAERLRASARTALQNDGMVGELEGVSSAFDERLGFDDLVGKSPAMLEAVEVARKAARSSIPVLIEGESGVGKEMFARAIQQSSDRRNRPFVTVNCGAIPPNLVESILFGHEKGAFTGASDRHIGKFQEADGGTLFLDEVGELPLDIQVKLLRALQDGEIDPIGSRRPVTVDIRLISATNRDMMQLVRDDKFREDLYYRLNVFPVRIPPLRQRREDIPELATHFVERISRSEKIVIKPIKQDAMTLLANYGWPGNIRQLQNAIFRAVILCDDNQIASHDFPQILAQAERRALRADSRLDPVIGAHDVDDDQPLSAALRRDYIMLVDDQREIRRLIELEKEILQRAIHYYDGRMSEVARRLGIGRSTLYRKVADFGLEVPDRAGPLHRRG